MQEKFPDSYHPFSANSYSTTRISALHPPITPALLDILDTGLPAGTEFLDLHRPQCNIQRVISTR